MSKIGGNSNCDKFNDILFCHLESRSLLEGGAKKKGAFIRGFTVCHLWTHRKLKFNMARAYELYFANYNNNKVHHPSYILRSSAFWWRHNWRQKYGKIRLPKTFSTPKEYFSFNKKLTGENYESFLKKPGTIRKGGTVVWNPEKVWNGSQIHKT